MSEGLWKLYAIIVSGVFVLAGAGAAIMWPDANVERQTDVQFVTLAMAILSKEVTEHDQRPLREWAIEIINEHSKVEIGDDARQALLEEAWPLDAVYSSFPPGIKFPPGSTLPPGWWFQQQPIGPEGPVPPPE